MKVLICGSRSIESYKTVKKGIEDGLQSFEYTKEDIEQVIHGGAEGVDSLAQAWADDNEINTKVNEPEWEKYGKSAALRRNEEMVDTAEFVIAIWDGESSGTKYTIDCAEEDTETEVFVDISGGTQLSDFL